MPAKRRPTRKSPRRKVANPRAPSKTVEVLVIQGNYGYGHGWEDVSEYDKSDRVLARADLKEYRATPGSHRLITRRVPRTPAVQNPSKRKGARKAPKRTAAQRSASARKGAMTRARNAGKRR